MEYDDLIDSVQEFRTEYQLDLIHHVRLHTLVVRTFVFFGHESKTLRIDDCLCPGIGCHDDNRITEIYFSGNR